jgi:DNA-binding transcriptional MerR regulator
MYKIGEFSRLSQTPIRTLRYYDQIRLVVPAHIDRATGYRSYAAEQLERLNRILVYKELGLSLDEIRAVFAERAQLTEVHDLVRQKHAELQRLVDAERRRLARATARLELMERTAATANIAIRLAPSQWVASVRRKLRSHDDCDGLFDELDHQVRGRRDHRQRGAIWHTCASGEIDCEVYEVLPARIAPAGRVAVRELPAQRVASLVYRGDTDYLAAYRAMRTWIARSELAITGPKREVFLRSPGSSVTEIQFPVAQTSPA